MIYKHYKGGLYRFLVVGIKESNGEEQAIYESLTTGMVFVRPLEEFNGKLEVFCEEDEEGLYKEVKRFELQK